MAQAGYTPIQLYYSTTTTNVPTSGNLASGELAINITDGKLFYKDNGGSVQVIAWKTTPTTAGGTGLTSWTAGDLPYYATGTTLSKLGIGTAGQVLTSTGTAPQWSTLSGVAVTTFSAGTTGFTPSSATSGAVTLAGTLATTNGGTGLTSFTANRVFYASSTSAIGQSANLTFDGTTLTANALTTTSTVTINGGTANGVAYLNGSKVLTTGSALTFDGATLAVNSGATGLNTNFNSTSASGVYVRFQNSGISIGDVGAGAQIVSGGAAGDFGITSRAGSLVFGQNSTEGMRLTSTGLGIGTSSPAAKLDVLGSSSDQIRVRTAGTEFYRFGRNSSTGFLDFYGSQTGYQGYTFGGVDGTWMTINASGNLGLGVTPSAWNASFKALQLNYGAFWNFQTTSCGIQANAYNDGNWKYVANGLASGYEQFGGTHVWRTAPSGTAGNIISFTQAMTLDASGNLGIGQTNPSSKLEVTGVVLSKAPGNLGRFDAQDTNSGGAIITINPALGAAGTPALQTQTNHPILFAPNNTERARITSVGNFSLGTHADRGTTVGTNAIQIFNGTAPAGTLTNGVSLYSSSGDLNFMNSAGNGFRVGYRNLPPVGTQTGSYTLAAGDVGKYVQVSTGGSITIPTSVFAEGDAISIYNNTTGNITITCSAPTAYIAGTNTVRTSMTLATRGVATILFYSATACVVSGNVT